MPTQTPKPLTAPEKAFWKDAFVACAATLHVITTEEAVTICANFADAALKTYRERIIWRKP